MHYVNLIVMFRWQPSACLHASAGLRELPLDGSRALSTAPRKPKASPKSNIDFTPAESANYGFYQKNQSQLATEASTQEMAPV
jgi:hypothetical protein